MSEELNKWRSALSGANKEKYSEYVKEWETKIGSFIEFNPAKADDSKIPFGVKDNIAVEGLSLTCGSKMLKNLRSPYTATAVQKLLDSGDYTVVGKNNLDEFGMGSSTDNSAIMKTNNPYDAERVAGGSSGGSAAAVAAGLVPFALGTDTGGSVRQPAHFCGIYGLKPTYGTVSRYGLTAYASSLEVIGVLARDVDTTREVYNIIKGKDEMDQTSVAPEPEDIPSKTVKTVGVLKLDAGVVNDDVKKAFEEAVTRLKDLGYEVKIVEIPTLDYVVPAYYTIAMGEASANLARYNGIRYGHAPEFAENPIQLQKKSREEGFGPEVKLRVLLGTYVLRSGFQDQFYIKAQKIRTAILNNFNEIFADCDVLMMPVFPSNAFHHGNADLDSLQQKVADIYTCSANLAGIPALTVPSALQNGIPSGVQFLAPAFGEERLFSVAEKYATVFDIPSPEGFSMDWSK